MTRYEKFKDGMEFLGGEGSAKTIEEATELARDMIECAFCPCYKECQRVLSIAGMNDNCRNILKEYLGGEV